MPVCESDEIKIIEQLFEQNCIRFLVLAFCACAAWNSVRFDPEMQKAFINVAGVPTHVMTWGKWVEESLDDTKEIIVCVTGNPGLPGYYTQFISSLYNDLNDEIPIWLIGKQSFVCIHIEILW